MQKVQRSKEKTLTRNRLRFASGDLPGRRRQPMHTKEDLPSVAAFTGSQLESGGVFEDGEDYSGDEKP